MSIREQQALKQKHYQSNIAKIDKKMLNSLNGAYDILHLWRYYDGTKDTRVVNIGFDTTCKLIEKIKPNFIES
jgi:hypothetical protein